MKHMLTFALVIGMSQLLPSLYPQEKGSRSDERRLHRVSLIRVIANPGEFDGEHIQVAGCLGGAGLDDAPGVFVSDRDAP